MWLFALLAGCRDCEKEVAPPHTAEACADFYAEDIVPEFSVVIAPEEWEAMQDEYTNWRQRRRDGLDVKPYHPLASFRYGDEVVGDAMIRLKGNPCCSWEGDKLQFVIAFNQVDRDGRFHGVRKISLDAPFYDPSALRERVALSYFEDAGFPAACANHAKLTINGQYYGAYTNIEFVDDEFIQRQFPTEERGTLYKFDFLSQRWENQNDDTGVSDLLQLYALGEDLEGTIDAFDIDQALSYWGAEAAINQSDGYWAGSINFFLYENPIHGWQFIPWDLDNAIDFWNARRNPFKRKDHHGEAPHIDLILDDPHWRGEFETALGGAHRHLNPDVLLQRIDRWDAQVRPLLEAEPHLPYTMREHDEAVQSLRDHIGVRDVYLCGLLEGDDEE